MRLTIDAQKLEQRKAEQMLAATWRLLDYKPWHLVDSANPLMRRNLQCFDIEHPMYLFTFRQ